MSSKVYPFGNSGEVGVAAAAKVAVWSKAPYTVYQRAGYPNHPDTWDVLKEGLADEEYVSGAFAAAGHIKIAAGSSELFYNIGTDARPFEEADYVNQPDPVALDATGAITAAMITSGIITSTTAAAVTGTLPAATVLDAAFDLGINKAIDFSVIATGANAFTVAVAAGVTNVGDLVVATATAGRFRLRKTAATTYVIYRLCK
jgi:hypothetical protein